MIWGRSVCNEHGGLYHYGEPQSASDIGTPGTPQIASVIGTGGLKIGGSPYYFYTGPLNCGHLDIAATYLGTDLKLHQDCTNLVSDLRSPRYSVLQPLLETPNISNCIHITAGSDFCGCGHDQNMTTTMHISHQKVKLYTVVN